MDENVKIVQFINNGNDTPNFCLDDQGNLYRVEYNKRNELTLVKQKINVVKPS